MEEWEAEDAARRAAALKANEEEGWTVVQRHKVGGAAGGGARAGAQGWVQACQKFLCTCRACAEWVDRQAAALPPAPAAHANARIAPALPQGRKKNASASGVTVAGVAGTAAAAQLAEKAKKDTSHSDFYRFQQREKRRDGGGGAGRRGGAGWAGAGLRARGVQAGATRVTMPCRPAARGLLRPQQTAP